MNPACCVCCHMMFCRENDIAVIVGDALYFADLYECECCGEQIVSGWATKAAGYRGDAVFRRWENIAMKVTR